MRILVIDENKRRLNRIQSKLFSCGIENVVTLAHPDRAFNVIDYFEPTAVIAALHMSPVDGLEVATGIRKNYPHVPVILFGKTPPLPRDFEEACLPHNQFISEPFGAGSLYSKLLAVYKRG